MIEDKKEFITITKDNWFEFDYKSLSPFNKRKHNDFRRGVELAAKNAKGIYDCSRCSSDWIKVTDRLPEMAKTVLVQNYISESRTENVCGTEIALARYCCYQGWVYFEVKKMDFPFFRNVKYWLEYPEPPNPPKE